MKAFSILLLLLAALTAATAIPNPHAFGLVVCGCEYKPRPRLKIPLTISDDDGCLTSLYGRALMASSSNFNELATATSAHSSSDQITTVIVDSYTTVPCSAEESNVSGSTTTVSKHTTTTDLITVTVTPSRYDTSRNVGSLANFDSQQHFHP